MPSRRTRSTLSGCHHSMMSDGPRVHLRPSRTCTGTDRPPCLEAEGIDSRSEKPTYQWFQDHDARSFLAALRRHHDRPFGEFWDEDLELGDDERDTHGKQRMMQQSTPSNSSSAGGNHDTVWRRLLVDALRTRLNLYVRAYQEANGTNDLLTDSTRPRESSLRSR